MNLKERVEELVRVTDFDNATIYEYLNSRGTPCSKRSVRRYANPLRAELENASEGQPNILLLDIETGPMLVYTWSLWPKFISIDKVVEDTTVLCWSAKWLFDPTIMHQSVSAEEARERKDDSVLEGVWHLLDKADIVIAHNGAKFDTRVLNTRFITHGLTPPMPYRVVDTYKVARSAFNLPSYKLEYINRLLKLTPKQENEGFELWRQCLQGSEHHLRLMQEYCDVDVLAVEDCYLELRPWIKSHPNIALFINTTEEVCTNCGDTELEWKGRYITPAGRYKAFRCSNCGAIGRARYSDLSTEERRRLHLSVAR